MMTVELLQAPLWSLGMKIMPAICLPQNANAPPFVQLYVQLQMKHHTGAFLFILIMLL